MTDPRGLSLVLAVGRWGGFYARCGKVGATICLGWVSLTLWLADIDRVLSRLARIADGVNRVMSEEAMPE